MEYFGLKTVTLSYYFWVPVLIALADLLFYVLVPILLIGSVAPEYISSGVLAELLHVTSEYFGIGGQPLCILMIIAIAILRAVLIRSVENIFALSLSKNYKILSEKILDFYLKNIADNALINKLQARKILNSELNNYFFGRIVPLSFCLSEVMLVAFLLIYGTYLFGLLFVVAALFVATLLFALLYVVRKRAILVGRSRSKFEEKRLDLIELALHNGFSVTINGGQKSLMNFVSKITEGFSNALSIQVVLPFSTKALIDAALVVFAVFIANRIDIAGSIDKYAILGGLLIRVMPSLSRIASYIETMRINKVAVMEIREFLSIRSVEPAVLKHSKLYDSLSNLNEQGVYIIVGASGIGKTTTIKQWVSALAPTKTVAYLDQMGFANGVPVEEYLQLVGLDCIQSKNILNKAIDFGINNKDLSHMSGGQAKFLQFLALAQKDAAVYVFDEPSVGLDPKLKKLMIEIIGNLSTKSIVVIVSHDRPFIREILQLHGAELIEVQ